MINEQSAKRSALTYYVLIYVVANLSVFAIIASILSCSACNSSKDIASISFENRSSIVG